MTLYDINANDMIKLEEMIKILQDICDLSGTSVTELVEETEKNPSFWINKNSYEVSEKEHS